MLCCRPMFWHDSLARIVSSTLPGATMLLLLPYPHLLAALFSLMGGARVTQGYQQPCTFPSIVRSATVEECQWNAEKSYWWCPVTEDYDLYQQWRVCANTSTTFAGNDAGRGCVFPFQYQGRVHRWCLRASSNGGYWWCATTPSYDRDKRWTRCLPHSVELPCRFEPTDRSLRGVSAQCRPFREKWICLTEVGEARECPRTEDTYAGNDPGQACKFPFYYLLTEYQNCIRKRRDGQPGDESFAWCSTTTDYDQEHRWTRCSTGKTSRLSQTLLAVIVGLCVLVLISVLACIIYYVSDPTNVLRRYCQRRKRQRSQEEERRSPRPSRRRRHRSSDDDDDDDESASPRHQWSSSPVGGGRREVAIPLTPTAPPPPYEKVMQGRPAFLMPPMLPMPPSPSPSVTVSTPNSVAEPS